MSIIQTQIIDKATGVDFFEVNFTFNSKKVIPMDDYKRIVEMIDKEIELINKNENTKLQ
jgi:hypothetical protein